MPQHAAAMLTAMPWPSACRQESRAALPAGSCARASLGRRLSHPHPSRRVALPSRVHQRTLLLCCTHFSTVRCLGAVSPQRGVDSCIAAKRAASHQVTAAAAMPWPCTNTLRLTPRWPHASATIKGTPPIAFYPHPTIFRPPVCRHPLFSTARLTVDDPSHCLPLGESGVSLDGMVGE
jgi:hypothetical protein